jgi:hypothetical protein
MVSDRIAIQIGRSTICAIVDPSCIAGSDLMDASSSALDPVAAQQLVARYVGIVQEHAAANAFPAPVTTLPASKPAIKNAVRVVLEALVATNQLTNELETFLEEAFVALANYVDAELAVLAIEHRQASAALEADPRPPRERFGSPNWAVVERTSRLAGEIARASAEEASALRREFRALVEGPG